MRPNGGIELNIVDAANSFAVIARTTGNFDVASRNLESLNSRLLYKFSLSNLILSDAKAKPFGDNCTNQNVFLYLLIMKEAMSIQKLFSMSLIFGRQGYFCVIWGTFLLPDTINVALETQ